MSENQDLMAPGLTEEKLKALNEAKEKVRARYGENKRITDDSYDRSLAVQCVNGTFVGNIIKLNRKAIHCKAFRFSLMTLRLRITTVPWAAQRY